MRGDTFISGGVLEIIANENSAVSEMSYAHIYSANLIWEGGKISTPFLDSEHVGESGKALIELTGDFSRGESIASEFYFEYDLSLIQENSEYKLVFWNGSTDFTESDFKDNSGLYSYKSNYRLDDAGKALYVSFSSVPEPATFAFGLEIAAVAMLTFRRRK